MAFGESPGQERTEQPTARRRDEACQRGRVARSPDLTAALLLLGALGAHSLAGGRFAADVLDLLRAGLSTLPRGDLTQDGAQALVSGAATAAGRLVWPLLMIPAVVAVGAQLLQTRFVLAPGALAAEWSRLDPVKGLARLLGGRSLVELAKSILKLGAVGGVLYLTLDADWPLLMTLGQDGPAGFLPALGTIVRDLWLRVGLAYLVLAGLDYGYQRWEHERSLRMTKAEIREETRETEGSPLLRSRVRALHRKMATRRMMAEVRRAAVVLRNPTHLAIALRYEQSRMRAPRVVGKGARLLALRIIEIARRQGIPVVENPPLTRTLFRSVAIGSEIPAGLYRAVAEVLAYVYSLRVGDRGPR